MAKKEEPDLVDALVAVFGADRVIIIDEHTNLPEEIRRCLQCGRILNIVQATLGPICGVCARNNHYEMLRKGSVN